MIPLPQLLSEQLGAAFTAAGLDAAHGAVVVSQRPDLCDFQCNGAFALAKTLKRNPRELAQEIAALTERGAAIAKIEIAGPGFLNITVAEAFLAARLDAMAAAERLGWTGAAKPERVILDYGGPNVAKAMHVGHLRSTIIGDSLRRILSEAGHETRSDVHHGDWGTQMGMVITEVRRRWPALPYFAADGEGPFPEAPPFDNSALEEIYPAAAARCKEDAAAMAEAREATQRLQSGHPGYTALWKQIVALSRAHMEEAFSELGVHFDLWLGESHYHGRLAKMVADLEKRGVAKLDDGAIIVPFDEDAGGLPPLLLRKSDGGYLYGTTDLATIQERVEDLGAQQILYVVDKRQGNHFRQVFAAARKAGYAGEEVTLAHIAFGTMNGPDGKPFKTRAGGVMRLEQLIEMVKEQARAAVAAAGVGAAYPETEQRAIADKVALAALKFADLSNNIETDYIFDIEKFARFEGKTGPYLQYAAVRIKSILRKAEDRGETAGRAAIAHPRERELALLLALYPAALDRALAEWAPKHICDALYALAQSFTRFYGECPVLNETDAPIRASRLAICQLTLRALEHGLNLLGIEAPERM